MLHALLLSRVIAQAGPTQSPPSASCAQDSEASVTTLVQPGGAALADDTKVTGAVTGEVLLDISPSGVVENAAISRSTGNAHLDRALLWASTHSKYSPKFANCHPQEGSYLYKFGFTPYSGDMARTTARFTTFFVSLLSTKAAPQDPTVQLDPNITSAQSLHLFSLYYSTLGPFRTLQFLGDDMVQGVHRFHYTAVFGGGKSVVMFVLDGNDNLVAFVNEG